MVGHLSGTGEERAATPDAAARRDSPDLGRLNPPEQEVLHLLAEGHTAKSIASLTGRSVAAVNERLREARRKTGASSSRELARLLKAQKSRDEKIGVDGASGAEQSMPLEAVPPSRRSARRWIVMSSLGIVGIAAAAIFLPPTDHSSTPSAPTPTSIERSNDEDPLLGVMFRRSRLDSTQLYERVRAEPREPGWAERTEAAIMTHYSDLVSSGRVRDLRATCGSTVCELAGIIAGNGVEGINRTMREVDGTHRDLQKRWRDKALSEIGLTRQAAAFGPAPKRDGTAFATYWVRSAP